MPPLSDHDRSALARIEAHLAIEDPDLAHLLATNASAPHRPIRLHHRDQLIIMIGILSALILVPTLIALVR